MRSKPVGKVDRRSRCRRLKTSLQPSATDRLTQVRVLFFFSFFPIYIVDAFNTHGLRSHILTSLESAMWHLVF